MPTLYLSPSAFGFLADECDRCYYNEVHGVKKRPRAPFPAIFSQIDSAMKVHLGAGQHVLDPALPAVTILSQGRRVTSSAIKFPGSNVELVIRGNYDSLVAFADSTLGIVDWKTTRVRPDLVSKYARSLHAYAYAMEHPASGPARKIDRLGLGVFEPSRFAVREGIAHLEGGFNWIDVERNDRVFTSFINRIAQLLDKPVAPKPTPSCAFCSYIEAA